MDLFWSYRISYTSKWGNLWIVHHLAPSADHKQQGSFSTSKKTMAAIHRHSLVHSTSHLDHKRMLGGSWSKKMPQRNHGYFLLGSGGLWNWCPVWKLRELSSSRMWGAQNDEVGAGCQGGMASDAGSVPMRRWTWPGWSHCPHVSHRWCTITRMPGIKTGVTYRDPRSLPCYCKKPQ